MTKRKHDQKDEKAQQPASQKDKELQALYAKMRRQFTAADLQKYTEIESGIPLEDVIVEMEQIHRQACQTKRKKA